MHRHSSGKIRNVVLLSHSGAGKTSLAEAMLFNSGTISRLGNVADGTTISDYDPAEVKRQISINLSLLPLVWKESKLNLIDTPGYPDFVAEVKAGLAISEGAIIVVCAVSSVEVGTEQVWRYVNEVNLPSLIFINKMDRENANFFNVLKDIQAKLGTRCVPIQLPIGSQKDFQGVVDLVSKKAYTGTPPKETELPPSIADDVNSYHEKLVEAVVEVDDELIARYLDGEEISEEQICRCLKAATKSGKVVPVLVGSALKNIAVTPLLDAIPDYLPSPEERGAVIAANVSTKTEETVEPSAESPLSALVFKTINDPRMGRLSYLRVYSGTLYSNSQAWNANKETAERIGQLFILRGKNQEPVPQLTAGDIGVVAKLTSTSTGDTLSLREHPLKLAPIQFPEPVLNMAAHPKSRADLDKMSTVLPKICEEDPSLKVQREVDIGEILLCGMGDTHLEVAAERLSSKFGVEVNLQVPKVPYKETITITTKAEYKHKKQTGGHGQYGHVFLELEPLPRGAGFEFTERVVGGAVPKNYIPAVEKGVNEARLEGVLAGYPVVDVKVTLYDGSSHPVDSSDMSFKIAGAQALKKGLSQAQPVLLEPIVSLAITVPDSLTGDIIGDLNTKRARVLGMTPSDGMNIIEAQAPLAEVQRYAVDLRSMTQGRGTFTIEFSHYEEVPPPIAQKIIAQRSQP
ncbi:MAG TPA: elongation factor G [Dehalococcoidia bacterium]|nr:elongation factor G [Dehalococcoidia bacterium]